MTVTTGTPNYEAVIRGSRIVHEALAPFVYHDLTGRFGAKWYTGGVLNVVSDQQRRDLPASGKGKELADDLDLLVLLFVMDRQWGTVFTQKLPREARNYVNELIGTRHKWAHTARGDWSEDDAWRALDTMTRLLEAMQSPAARDTEALGREVRGASYAATPQVPVIEAPIALPMVEAPSKRESSGKTPAV